MNTDELLAYNLKYDLPFVNTYDDRYAGVSLRQLEENTEKDACMYYELATRYRQGIGGAPTSPEKAYQYYQKVLYSQRNIRAMKSSDPWVIASQAVIIHMTLPQAAVLL